MENSYFKKAEIGAWLSIAAYMVLSAIKLIMSQIGNSEALRADGLNNLTDIIASVAVLIGLKISQKPPDENHRYGHSRAETIASLVASLTIIEGHQIAENVEERLHEKHLINDAHIHIEPQI